MSGAGKLRAAITATRLFGTLPSSTKSVPMRCDFVSVVFLGLAIWIGAAVTAAPVELPDDALTAGIPGDGALTLDDVRAWLAKPENHEPLDIQLPLGLDAGQTAIKGVDANPLTRAKIELGRQLFFDKRLSADGTVSCADCHHPAEGFTKHTRFGVGIRGQEGGRNSPVSYNRILSDKQFWDGRAASLEEQAKGPIENPIEMGNTHEAAVKTVAGIEGYRVQFARVFGDVRRGNFVNIDNIAKAIASFERVIVTGASPFDYQERVRSFQAALGDDLETLEEDDPDLFATYQQYLSAAQAHPMSESARRGREVFFSDRGRCTTCHVGPNLTDELYHNLGVGMDAEDPDLGRYVVTNVEADKGAFKTPTIRNVEWTAPYMHDGSQKTLEEVVEWYDRGGHPNAHLSEKVVPLKLTAQEKADLVEFMRACTGPFPKVETARLPE